MGWRLRCVNIPACLIGIGSEIFESAKLDGANTIKRIWYIDIPSLIGQFRYFLIFGIIGGLQDYGVQVILTKGGPGYSTYVPGYYMYTVSFTGGLMGYGCAIGTILFILIFIVSTFTFRYLKEGHKVGRFYKLNKFKRRCNMKSKILQ